MMVDPQAELVRQIEILRERLQGAEEMRRALISEELDGFVVGDEAREPRVVLLETSAPAVRPLFERLPQAAVTVSPSGAILYANQRFADLIGRSLASLFSSSMADVLAPGSRADFHAYLASAVADAAVNVTLMHRGGHFVEATATTVAMGNGYLSLLIAELESADSDEDAREALRAINDGEIDGVVVGGEAVILLSHAHQSYRALVDRMHEGAVTVSIDGHVLYANDRFAAMVGKTREDVLGQSLGTVLGTDAVDDMVRSGARQAAELTILHADGGRMRVGISAERMQGVDAVTLVLRDLTERDRHVEMQERAQRNDRFLAVLAHELRNPLGAVRNAVEILHRSGALVDSQRFALDVIGRQSETLVRLVDDLLDVHRLNEDKIVLKRHPVDMRDVIRSAVEAARPRFVLREQQVEVEMPETEVHVDADVVRLAQVLGNLLVNASKFTPMGGHVRVVLELARSASGAEVARVRVEDDGIGVPPGLLEKIFEPYTQAPQDRQAFPEGLGLGLSVARRMVHLHGGTIAAHSDGIGCGTTLLLELPTCAERPPAALAPACEARSHAPLRILIADDDADSASSLAQVLALLGHDVHTARNGLEALAMADDLKPQVVILDIGMPQMDGWTAGRALRQRPWAQGLILYALTGWSQPHARERTTDAGFDRHFAKPLAFDDLARDLHERAANH